MAKGKATTHLLSVPVTGLGTEACSLDQDTGPLELSDATRDLFGTTSPEAAR